MPKGDRLKLKADPEDGTTPIANLLLEAVAMSHISGLQKGAIIFLWRKTYGWQGKDGKRLKEAKITLGDWCKALDRDKSRISKALIALEQMNVIRRRVIDIWGGYYYSLNTSIASWNSDSINLSKLSETVEVAHLPTVGENATIVDKANSRQGQQQSAELTTVGDNIDATVGENATPQLTKTPPPTLYKERLNKDKESINNNKNKTGIIFKTFDDNFQRMTERTRDVLGDYIDTYGADEVLIALNKAIKQNKRSLAYVEGILKGHGKSSTDSKTKARKYKPPEAY